MEEKKNLSNKVFGCDCGHKSLLCWTIGFVVLIIVFCAGFKLGKLTTYFHPYGQRGYGYQPGSMMRWNDQGYGTTRGWKAAKTLPTEQTDTILTTTTKE